MTLISNSITLHRKPKDGINGQDAVVYTLLPTETILPEGATGTHLAVQKTVGSTTTLLTYIQATKEGITLIGEADATDHVEWNLNDQQLYLEEGVVYGKNYTIVALKNGQRVASITIGVTAKGEQGEQGEQGEPGERGEDGTAIEIKGTAIAYYPTVSAYNSATKVSGDYLVGQSSTFTPGHPEVLYDGAYIYTYNADTNTTTKADAVKGDTYLLEADGHLYVATQVKAQHTTVGNGLYWLDAGEIRGKDAISLQVEGDNVIFPQTGSRQLVYVDVYRGTTKLDYIKEEYTCLALSATSDLCGGRLDWNFGIRQGRFYYELKVKSEYRGTNITGTIPYTVIIDGVEYRRNINVRTVLNGQNGYNGCLIRRTEWQPGKTYRNDSAYDSVDPETGQYIIDEVVVSDFDHGNGKRYICQHTHLSDAADKNVSAETLQHTIDNLDCWQPLSDAGPIVTPFADITNAFIQFLQANQLLVTNPDGTPYGAFGAATDANPYPLWFGGNDPKNAVARFDKSGSAWLGPNFSVVNGVVTAKNMQAEGGKFNNITAEGGTFKDINVKRLYSPWKNTLDSDQSDNIYTVGTSGTTAFFLPNTPNNSGRVIRISTDDLGTSISDRNAEIHITPQEGKTFKFYEDGITKDSITISNQLVELIGRGSDTNFTGYIVLRRIDLATSSVYGRNLGTIAYGRMIETDSGTDDSQQHSFDGSRISITTYEGKLTVGGQTLNITQSQGVYKMLFPKEWNFVNQRNNVKLPFVQVCGFGSTYNRSGLHPVTATVLIPPRINANGRAEVFISVSDSDGPQCGSFQYTIHNSADFSIVQ